MTRKGWAADIAMLIGALYFLLPLAWLLISSTKSNADLFTTFGFFFSDKFNFLENVQALIERDDGVFLHWMLNSAIYAVSAALGAASISALAGYALAMYQFRGRRLIMGLILASVFVPTTILAVPLYLMIGSSGLSNTLWAVILPSLVFPFGVFLMFIYAQAAIPPDLLDAGRVDGAGEYRIFGQITFRLLAPAFVTVILFAFVGAWNNYFLPLLVLRGLDVYTAPVGLAFWNSLAFQPGQSQVLYSIVITGSVLAVVPVMVVFIFLQRYWRAGLSLGSVRG